MASAVTQAISAIGDLGTKFGTAFGIGGSSLTPDMLSADMAASVNNVMGNTDAKLVDAKSKAEAEKKRLELEAGKVINAKKNSSAGQASGRQGTMASQSVSGGSLLGGGQASIGSKTLLGQ